jgi:hypothetical protein
MYMGGLKNTRNIIIAVSVMGVLALLMLLFGQNLGTSVDENDYYNTPVPMLIEFVKSSDATSENQVYNSSLLRDNLNGNLVVRFVVVNKDEDAELLKEYEQKYGKIGEVPYHILTDKDRNMVFAKSGYMTLTELSDMLAEHVE